KPTASPAATSTPAQQTSPARETTDPASPLPTETTTTAPDPNPSAPSDPPRSPVAATFVQALEIQMIKDSGSSQGIVINNVLYFPGHVLNPQLGLKFNGFSPENKELIFEDNAGAIYTRHY